MENKVRTQLIEMYIKSLNEGKLPWRQGWDVESPTNPVTHKAYRGVNNLILKAKGYDDPRWLTFKQAADSGWSVRKHEHGTPVEYWSIYDRQLKTNISFQEYSKLPLDERASDRYTRILKIHTVFNAKQIDGIPVYEKTNKQLKFSQIENTFVPTLVKNMRIDVQHGGNEAYYSPTSDLITLPPKKSFHEAYEYTATLLHELAHATSHNTRLDRAVSGKFGSKEYAKEELRAEISSSFVAGELNLNQTSSNLDNHKAYIQNWLGVLNKEPNELFRAISESQKISDYLLEKGEYKKLIKGQDINMNLSNSIIVKSCFHKCDSEYRIEAFLYKDNSIKVSLAYNTDKQQHVDVRVKNFTEFCENLPKERLDKLSHEIADNLVRLENFSLNTRSTPACYDYVSDNIYDQIHKADPTYKTQEELEKIHSITHDKSVPKRKYTIDQLCDIAEVVKTQHDINQSKHKLKEINQRLTRGMER